MPVTPPRRAACLTRCGACAALLAALAPTALAAPNDGVDPLAGLLADKGLIAPGSTGSGAPVPPHEPGALQRLRERAAETVLTALNYLGVRYASGGTSESDGFDCSGFTRHVFSASLGVVLPRRADEQARAAGLVEVKHEDLQPGDLVFFNTLRRTFSHVGIYIGENRFVHAPRPGREVRTEDMGHPYWRIRFTGARRVDSGAPAQSLASGTGPTLPSPY